MSQHVAAETRRLDDELRALRREMFSPAPSMPEPVPVPGSLAEPTPEWVFKRAARQSAEDAWLERTSGITLNGYRHSSARPKVSFGKTIHALIELRDHVVRCEGERHARLQHTKAAIEARQAQAEDRRKAILLICTENSWLTDARGTTRLVKQKLIKDPRFQDKNKKPLYAVSRRTIADDLNHLATMSLLPLN
jgi:hypothetical protein